MLLSLNFKLVTTKKQVMMLVFELCLSTFYTAHTASVLHIPATDLQNTVCPTRYRTRHFFNNSNTNEDIATKFEQEYVRCVSNEKECVCGVCL